VTVLAAILAATVACSSPSSPDGESRSGSETPGSPAASALIGLANTERARAGLGLLTVDARLAQAAQIHAEQMADIGRVDHVLPGARYPALADRLGAAGYEWQAVGENLAAGQQNATQAMAAWMQSSAHRENILNATFTEMGAAYVVDRNGRPYYVQVFGRPRS
jgi:uncharacterized protein YkwD